MKRLAKLKSDVIESSNSFRVVIMDDESDMPDEPVIWLDAMLEYEGGDGNEDFDLYDYDDDYDNTRASIDVKRLTKKADEEAAADRKLDYIDVSAIDFDDKLYFAMPKERQDVIGSLLLKKFIKYYNSKYGRNTEQWVPVSANFANYDLQEKFKQAVDAGIFPPESKDKIQQTTEQQYNQHSHFNKDNRRIKNDMKENPEKYFPTLNIVDGYFVNPKFSALEEAMDEVNDKYSFANITTLNGALIDGNVNVVVPTSGNNAGDTLNDLAFVYDIAERNIMFGYVNSIDEIKKFIVGNESNIQNCLDVIDTIQPGWFSDPKPISTLFQSTEVVSSKLRRGK